MNSIARAPRAVSEALERYAPVALFAIVVAPLAPDVAADLASGAVLSAVWRLVAMAGVVGAVVALLRLSRRRSRRRHALARARMAGLGHYDVLVAALGPTAEFRAAGREGAESVLELLIDGAGAVTPELVVLVTTPQVPDALAHAVTENVALARPGTVVTRVAVSDPYDPVRVAREVLAGLADIIWPGDEPVWRAVRAGRRSAAVDLTGATALVSVGLARVAHEWGAPCVYVSGRRGPGGRFVAGQQNRHLVAVAEIFEPGAAPGV